MIARRLSWFVALLGVVIILSGCSLGALIPGLGNAPVVSQGPEPEVIIPETDQQLAPHVPSQIVVKMTGDRSLEDIVEKIGAIHYEPIVSVGPASDLSFTRAMLLTLPEGISLVDVGRQLEALDGVEYAEPNYVVSIPDMHTGALSPLGGSSVMSGPSTSFPNDPHYIMQWGLHKINAEAAWEITTGSEDVVIAILDTGIDLTHIDLQDKIIGGYNAFNPDAQPMDFHNHGTHVAGVAAAPGNDGIGMAGIAWQSPLLAVKVLGDNGQGTLESVVNGFYWVVDWARQNPDKRVVINMSLGFGNYSQLLKELIDLAISEGIVVVASAGNSYNRQLNYPAAFQGVIGVGATDPNDKLSPFSTIGRHVSVVAPGIKIHSSVSGGNKYAIYGGTSMAAPHVAGAAALLLAIDPTLSPGEVKSILEETAVHPLGLSNDEQFGYGRIDLEAALKAGALNKYGQVVIRLRTQGGLPIIGGSVTLISPEGEVIGSELTTSSGEAIFWFVPPGFGYTAEINLLLQNNGQVFSISYNLDPFLVTKGYKEIPVTFTL